VNVLRTLWIPFASEPPTLALPVEFIGVIACVCAESVPAAEAVDLFFSYRKNKTATAISNLLIKSPLYAIVAVTIRGGVLPRYVVGDEVPPLLVGVDVPPPPVGAGCGATGNGAPGALPPPPDGADVPVPLDGGLLNLSGAFPSADLPLLNRAPHGYDRITVNKAPGSKEEAYRGKFQPNRIAKLSPGCSGKPSVKAPF